MRDIEFRAWDKDNKEMITSEYNDDHYIMTLEHGKPNLLEYTGDEFGTYGNVDADFMQFTGLLDAEGNKVFEGDLVEVCGNENGCLQVEFKNAYVGGWVLTHYSTNDYVSLGARKQSEIKVKGNIYQHPHLIKGGK